MKLLKIVLATSLFVAGIAVCAEDPPPEHAKMMKDLGKYQGALRKGENVEQNANDLAKVMPEVAKFWRTRNSDIAMKSCKEARDGAMAIAKAAAANDKAGVSAGMKMMGAGCKGCHDQHREKVGENEYKIK